MSDEDSTAAPQSDHGGITINPGPYEYLRLPMSTTGWICPVCNRGNSPWIGQCPCVPLAATSDTEVELDVPFAVTNAVSPVEAEFGMGPDWSRIEGGPL